ncbi:MAG: CesT family type III secretion system chaperone [Pseudomonadota bacterium]
MTVELDKLLTAWAERCGVALNPADGDGWRHFVFDGRYEVAVNQIGDRLVLQSDVVDLPARPDEAEALIARLLKLALARARRSSESLSCDTERGTLTLQRVIDARAAELVSFETAMGEFVNALSFWSSRTAAPAARRGPLTAQPKLLFP